MRANTRSVLVFYNALAAVAAVPFRRAGRSNDSELLLRRSRQTQATSGT